MASSYEKHEIGTSKNDEPSPVVDCLLIILGYGLFFAKIVAVCIWLFG